MGTTVNTVAGQGVVVAEELARLLKDNAAGAPKAPAASRRRRPEEEALADPAASEGESTEAEASASEDSAAAEAEASDPYGSLESEGGGSPGLDGEHTLLAQAGGGQTGSAGVVSAAGEEGAGFGFPFLLFGGAGLGIAVLDNNDNGDGGGGGGGGGGGSPPTLLVQTPGEIANFADFHDQLGDTAPTVVDTTAESGTETFKITEGFERSDLPMTAAEIGEIVYDFRHSSESGEIGFEGLEVNIAGTPEQVNVTASAYASGSGDSEIVWLANLGVVEDLSGASADARVNAYASAFDGGDAEVGVSNLYVRLTGTGYITAAASLYARASGDDAQAAAHVGNDIVVSANADFARAYVDDISAEADDGTAQTTVGGDVSVLALGSSHASAYIDDISADVGTEGSASVSIGGDVLVTAGVSSGTAVAYVSDISASATAIDGVAQVSIGGDVQVVAGALAGDATAYVDDIEADASSHSEAGVSIAGDVTVAAGVLSGTARAYIDDISADADDGSDARVSIGGDVLVGAVALVGNAYAYVETVSADAETSSDAQVSIGGELSVLAGASNFASAYIDTISASADNGGDATVSIGSVAVKATASSAVAYLDEIEADADDTGSTGSDALVAIAGNVAVTASGTSYANAYVDEIEADASYDGTATVSIGGGVTVNAVAGSTDTSGTASAYLNEISADASSGGEARVFIGSVDVTANSENGNAYARLGQDGEGYGGIRADAGFNSRAEVTIAGDVSVKADAQGAEGVANAYVSTISAHASGGVALVSIGGDVSANAHAASTANALVNINAYAGGFGSIGRVSVAGNVAAVAAGASSFADVNLEATGAGEIDIEGEVIISASGSDAEGHILAANSGSISAGGVSLSVGSGGDGFLEILAKDDDSSISVGDLFVTVGEESNVNVEVQQSFTGITGSTLVHTFFSFSTFTPTFGVITPNAEVGIGDVNASVGADSQVNFYIRSVEDDVDRTATFTGEGDVQVVLGESELHNGEQTFGVINVGGLGGDFTLALNVGDLDVGAEPDDAETLDDIPSTVINGFNGDTDNIVFNEDPANGENFVALEEVITTEEDLFSALLEELNGETDYVFAVLDTADAPAVGVLAYDEDGDGVTSLIFLTGETTLTAADLNSPPPPDV